MDLSEKIKMLRHKNNLTLEQVGEAVGVGKSTVRKWETGEIQNMRRDKIAKLAAALHTTPGYLMGWDDEHEIPPLDEEKLELMNMINKINDEKKLEIINKFLTSLLD